MAEKVFAAGQDVVPVSVVIANGATGALSGAVELSRGKPCGVTLPDNIDSATALTYQISYDGGTTYNNFYDEYGTEYTTTVAASRSVKLSLADFIGATHMKVRLGTSGSPATVTDDRILKFALLP